MVWYSYQQGISGSGNGLAPDGQKTITRVNDYPFNSFPSGQIAAVLADDIFKYIFCNENDKIPIQSSLTLVPSSPIDNKPALVRVMAWHRTGH